ncbi:MAG: hypothetical protein KJO20_00625 [Eudoraea sp.]|nr:hypothetical protein [Eudoraea sp.]
MKRLLVDYKKLDHKTAALLIETYPDGYGDEDIIAFKNGNGELVQAVALRTEDTLYLVKISKSLSNFISSFEDSIEKELDNPSDSGEPELEFIMEDEMDDDIE